MATRLSGLRSAVAVLPSPRGVLRGFTLTELLVAVAIILVLVSLIGTAVSSVRASQKITATRDSIRKLNTIMSRLVRTYDSRPVSSIVLSSTISPCGDIFKYASEKRAWHIRRNILSGELADRWTDVNYMATGSPLGTWSPTPTQRVFVNIWNAAPSTPSDTFAGAECLFMIVTQSGMADPFEIRNLPPVGDKDGDGFMEFLDAWGNPIGYILFPYAVQLPGGSGQQFFSGTRAPLPAKLEDINGNNVLDTGETDSNGNTLADVPSATLGLRPLIYSAGPDGQLGSPSYGECGFDRNDEAGNLSNSGDSTGKSCGDWLDQPTSYSARPTSSIASDNITNLDDEAKQ